MRRQHPRLLFPTLARSSFIQADIALLRDVADVVEVEYQSPLDIPKAILGLLRCDGTFLWFASVRYLPLAIAAKMLGKRILIVCGGYDVAADYALGYGNMRAGWRRALGKLLVHMADDLLAMSEFARYEALRNADADKAKLSVVPLAVAPTPERNPRPARQAQVCTIGVINELSLLPDIPFVVAGEITEGARAALIAWGGPNLRILGRLTESDRQALFQSSAVYVQLSRHEAFGVAVAEAMLEDCTPFLSDVGSLREVGGDSAVFVSKDAADEAIANELRRILVSPPRFRTTPRQRILTVFSPERRRSALETILGRMEAQD